MELIYKEVKFSYEQKEDDGGRPEETHQYLAVETCDIGGGHYVVLQTDRWAVDSREEAQKLVDRIFDDLEKAGI